MALALASSFIARLYFCVTFALLRTQMCGSKGTGSGPAMPWNAILLYAGARLDRSIATICVAIINVQRALRVAQPNERHIPMKNSVQSLALAAAVAGLLGGTAVRLNAQPQQSNGTTSVQSSRAGVLLVAQDAPPADKTKHSCKGKNDCKGQGGGKNAGKNDCKGKGGCATDGSKSPKAA